MSFVIAFDNKVTGEVKSGGNNIYPRVGHAYIAEITDIEEFKGSHYIKIKGDNFTAGDYDSFRLSPNDNYMVEKAEKLANNVVASNESMKGAIGQESMDIYKWANKGLKVGVVYKVKNVNDGNGNWIPSKFVEPSFSIPVEQVEAWEPDTKAYEAHQAKFYPKGGNETPAPASSAPVTGGALPVKDELPF